MAILTRPTFSLATIQSLEQANFVFRELLDGTPDTFGEDERSALLMRFTSIAMEHFRSIISLCESRLGMRTGLALFRPLIETIVRGEWLYFCADDAQLNSFLKRQLLLDSNPFTRMSGEVDLTLGQAERLDIFAPLYRKLCDFTLVGVDAVAQRLVSEEGFEPTYPEVAVRILLEQSAMATTRHYKVLFDFMGDQQNSERLAELFASIEVGLEETY